MIYDEVGEYNVLEGISDEEERWKRKTEGLGSGEEGNVEAEEVSERRHASTK